MADYGLLTVSVDKGVMKIESVNRKHPMVADYRSHGDPAVTSAADDDGNGTLKFHLYRKYMLCFCICGRGYLVYMDRRIPMFSAFSAQNLLKTQEIAKIITLPEQNAIPIPYCAW